MKHLDIKPTIPSHVAQRFHDRINRRGPDDCWPWIGKTLKNGYGRFSIWDGNRVRNVLAHRAIYFLHTGDWPPCVLHECDNPPCCNPKHLKAGTLTQNMRDMIRRGRRVKKMTYVIAQRIRELYATGQYSQKALCQMFNYSAAGMCVLLQHKAWRLD